MSTKRILLEFNEQAFNDLTKRTENARSKFVSLVEYCEENLEIEISDFNLFLKEPKQYCINSYWDKYGQQFGNSPVKKEKVIELTGWSDYKFEQLLTDTKIALSGVGPHRYTVHPDSIEFKLDPEEFKTYLRDEDRPLYELSLQFIETANKMEQEGGKVAWYLARYYPWLAVDGSKLTYSSSYFKQTPQMRKRTMFSIYS